MGNNIFIEYIESGRKALVDAATARLVARGELFYTGTFVTTYSEDGETSGEWLVRISEDDEEE